MRNRRQKDEARIDLTPMLDIVFIMLIFFIVTATFVKETGLDVNAAPHSPDDLTESGVIVRIDANNRIYFVAEKTRLIDLRRVRANLERAHAANSDMPVIIQAADAADTGIIVSIYNDALAVDRAMSISLARWN